MVLFLLVFGNWARVSAFQPKAFRRWRDTLLLLRQKKVSKEKATPGRSESPAQNRASKAAG
jgi:hypothetical protein